MVPLVNWCRVRVRVIKSSRFNSGLGTSEPLHPENYSIIIIIIIIMMMMNRIKSPQIIKHQHYPLCADINKERGILRYLFQPHSR